MKMSEISKYCGDQDLPPDSIPAERLNLPCCEGQTLLGTAAERGNIARIQALIDLGADPNGIDLHGRPPLVVATLNGMTSSVHELLKQGAAPDVPDTNGRTALMYALYLGHLEIANALTSNGAQKSVRDVDGRTAVDYAGHKTSGKDIKATVEFVKSLGVDPGTVKAKLSPMRSDPDFVTLEYIKRLKIIPLLRLAFFTWIGLAALEQLGALRFFWFTDFVFDVVPYFLGFAIYNSTPGMIVGWDSGYAPIITLLGWLVPFCLLLWPIIRQRRAAKKTKSPDGSTLSLDETFASIGSSNSSARGVANILKQGGRKAFDGLKRERPNQRAERKLIWITFAALFLLPNVLGIIQNVLFASARFTFRWYGEWYQWVPLNILLIFLIYLGWRTLASYAFSRALIAKQDHRNAHMSEHLDGLSHVEQGSNDYILYLRAFTQDGAVRIGNFDFEAVLTYSLSEVTDVVALGEKSGRLGPVELETTDETWEDRILELAKGARLIIMVPAATKNVAREVQILKDNALLSKCLFIAPPEDKAKGSSEQASRWAAMLGFGIFATLDIPAYLPSGFLFRLNEAGQLESWDALGLQLEPPPIVAGTDGSDSSDTDYSSDFDPSIADGGWESSSLANMTDMVIAQEQASMDQNRTHHNDHWDDHHNM